MSYFDGVNGTYEALGGLFLLQNCFRIHKDKEVKGISILSTLFFCSWGYWNLIYYSSLEQWFSLCGATFIMLTNTWWVSAAIYYTRKNKKNKKYEHSKV